MIPPSLVHQDALVGFELSQYLQLQEPDETWNLSYKPDMTDMELSEDVFYTPATVSLQLSEKKMMTMDPLTNIATDDYETTDLELSAFEKLISTHPPIFESLLSHLPTRALFNLYHTSSYLQTFLQSYPTAWNHLSFRLAQSSLSATTAGVSAGNESPNAGDRQSKAYALDQLLMTLVLPFGTRLKSLDLDNTLVSGLSLTSTVLPFRKETLEHLSVRGCKNVSLKYHLVPYLQLHLKVSTPVKGIRRVLTTPVGTLALKSLYAYRCRHHRRRPYLPVSLLRRDSDSEPTHELVNLCHKLGIWTDTAWCPTPGARCLRRRDYHTGRGGTGTGEVWVVFDRLWRSGNRIGPGTESGDGAGAARPDRGDRLDGRMWEEAEYGDDGEALGYGHGLCLGEGKQHPTHLRRSHNIFIDDIFCDGCGDRIPERCEQCSVRMHCMGCRRSFCASCAFDRHLPKRARTSFQSSPTSTTATAETTASLPYGYVPVSNASSASTLTPPKPSRTRDRFWWAPGAVRSPNLMREPSGDSESDSEVEDVNANPQQSNRAPAKLKLRWCCLEPMFSGGGGIAFAGPGMGGQGADKIRTAPLPRGRGWEDPDFVDTNEFEDYDPDVKLAERLAGRRKYPKVTGYLMQDNLDLSASTSPRSLCNDCYTSKKWKVPCQACKVPLCKEHDLRGLKMRVCGYRDLLIERDMLRSPPTPAPEIDGNSVTDTTDSEGTVEEEVAEDVLQSLRDLFWTLEDFLRLLQEAASIELPQSSDEDLKEDPYDWLWTMGYPRESGAEALKSSFSTIVPNFSFDPTYPETKPRTESEKAACRMKTSVGSKVCDDDHEVSHHWYAIGDKEGTMRTQQEPVEEWKGCGAYFCHASYRPMGDGRNRCTAIIRVCSTCGIQQCKDCLVKTPACDCSYCKVKKNCPNCYGKLEPGVCKKVAEEEERKAKAKREEEKRKAKEREKVQAEQIAEYAGEFWNGFYTEFHSSIIVPIPSPPTE